MNEIRTSDVQARGSAPPELIETALRELFGSAPPALCACVRSRWLAAQRLEVSAEDPPPLVLHAGKAAQEMPA